MSADYTALETAETTGDSRDHWRLRRPLETEETTGDCGDHWRLWRPLETAETTGDHRSSILIADNLACFVILI